MTDDRAMDLHQFGAYIESIGIGPFYLSPNQSFILVPHRGYRFAHSDAHHTSVWVVLNTSSIDIIPALTFSIPSDCKETIPF